MANLHRKSRLSAALDWGVSTLAFISAGFLVAAMPEDLFSSLVVRSGLPNLVEAAQPPLGATARFAAAAAAALFAFGFVLSLLRALDRAPSPARVADDVDAEPETLRLRKADAHPDAPPRRPILAGRDLGEPVEVCGDEMLLDSPVSVEPEPQPLPGFLVPQDCAADAADDEPEPEPDRGSEPEPRPSAEIDEEPEAEDGSGDEPAGDLSSLMARFETGLTRKQQAIVRPSPPPDADPAESPVLEEEPTDRVGHRLRSAIAELQKVSSQGR